MAHTIDLTPLITSMSWQADESYQPEIHTIRAEPSETFWQLWNDHKEYMKALGFHVTKEGNQWQAIVSDPALIQLLTQLES